MSSFAQYIQGQDSVFGLTAPFYYGDTTTLEFENGTHITKTNLGIYWDQGPTGPLETGGDFYNFFVLGFYPASFDYEEEFGITPDTTDPADSGQATSSSTSSPSSTSSSPAETSTAPSEPVELQWNYIAYPEPDVVQPDLGVYGRGFLSG
jgi:hypothetical protein